MGVLAYVSFGAVDIINDNPRGLLNKSSQILSYKTLKYKDDSIEGLAMVDLQGCELLIY